MKTVCLFPVTFKRHRDSEAESGLSFGNGLHVIDMDGCLVQEIYALDRQPERLSYSDDNSVRLEKLDE